MNIEEAHQDPGVMDLAVEVAAAAARWTARIEQVTGQQFPPQQMLEALMSAVRESRENTAPAGVTSLLDTRIARGMPALAAAPAAQQTEINLQLSFSGPRAAHLVEIASRRHGKVDGTTLTHVVTAAVERGISSLRRELGDDDP